MRRALLVLLLLLIASTTALRAAPEPGLPGRAPSAAPYSATPPLYDRPAYPYTAYTWDGQEWNSISYASIYTGMNFVLLLKAWTVKLALRTAEWAVDPSLTKGLLGRLATPATALGDSLWARPEAPLVAGGLVLGGGWALGLYLLGRRRRAWSILGAAAFTLVLAAAVLPIGDRIAGTIGDASDGLATALLRTIEGAVSASGQNHLLARAGDGAWKRLVYEPWLEGELAPAGAVRYRDPDGLSGGAFLALDGNGRRNACLFRPVEGAHDCPSWTTDGLPQRLLSAVATTVLSLLWAGGLLLVSGGLLLTRLTLGALLLLAPVWLLIALWRPPAALRLVQRLGELALGVLVKQLLLSAALGLFLLLSLGLNTALADLGWPLPAVLLALLGVGTVRYRYTWFRPLTAGPVHEAVSRTLVRRERERSVRSVAMPVPITGPVGAPGPVQIAMPPAEQVARELPKVGQTEVAVSALRQELFLRKVREEQGALEQRAGSERSLGPIGEISSVGDGAESGIAPISAKTTSVKRSTQSPVTPPPQGVTGPK